MQARHKRDFIIHTSEGARSQPVQNNVDTVQSEPGEYN